MTPLSSNTRQRYHALNVRHLGVCTALCPWQEANALQLVLEQLQRWLQLVGLCGRVEGDSAAHLRDTTTSRSVRTATHDAHLTTAVANHLVVRPVLLQEGSQRKLLPHAQLRQPVQPQHMRTSPTRWHATAGRTHDATHVRTPSPTSTGKDTTTVLSASSTAGSTWKPASCSGLTSSLCADRRTRRM